MGAARLQLAERAFGVRDGDIGKIARLEHTPPVFVMDAARTA
jgi:hypothetical protein